MLLSEVLLFKFWLLSWSPPYSVPTCVVPSRGAFELFPAMPSSGILPALPLKPFFDLAFNS